MCVDFPGSLRTIVLMDTHYHIWRYVRDEDGTIRFMERDDQVYPKRRQANYALTDGRQYWRAGQVLQCVDGAFCQPLPEEMVDRGMPSLGSKYVAIDQLEEQARSIRPAAKHVKAMKLRDELGAAGRIKKLEAVKVELAEHLAGIDAELARLVRQGEPKQGDTTMSQLNQSQGEMRIRRILGDRGRTDFNVRTVEL